MSACCDAVTAGACCRSSSGARLRSPYQRNLFGGWCLGRSCRRRWWGCQFSRGWRPLSAAIRQLPRFGKLTFAR
eukprot:7849928-Pyramimonas_sp.AAC.1